MAEVEGPSRDRSLKVALLVIDLCRPGAERRVATEPVSPASGRYYAGVEELAPTTRQSRIRQGCRVSDAASGTVVELRTPRSFRVMGALTIVAGGALVVSGPVTGALMQSVAGVVLMAGGTMPFRMRVDATASGLVLNPGFRTRRFEWREVETFRVLKRSWSGGGPGLFVLVAGELIPVPLPHGGGAVLSKRAQKNLAEVRDRLEDVRVAALNPG